MFVMDCTYKSFGVDWMPTPGSSSFFVSGIFITGNSNVQYVAIMQRVFHTHVQVNMIR